MTNVWMTLLGRTPGVTRLPMLVPMVLSNVPGGWKGPRRLRDVLDVTPDELPLVARRMPDFEFVLDDLVLRTTDELYRREGPAFTRLSLWLLAASSDAQRVLDEASQWSDVAAHLRGEAPDDHRRALLHLRRTVTMSDKQWKKIRKLFWMGPETRVVTPEDIAYAGLEEERAAARAKGLEEGREKGLEEGREKGLQKGLRQGLLQGRAQGLEQGLEEGLAAQRALVKDLLVARFGKVPKTVSLKLEKADGRLLRRCAKRASDVFA